MNKLYVETKTKIYFHPAYHLIDILNYEPGKKELLTKFLDKDTLDNFLQGNIDVNEKIAAALDLAGCAPRYFWVNLQKAWDKRPDKEK